MSISKKINPLPFITSLLSKTGKYFLNAASLDRAASMAYSTLLAFIPTLVIGLWLTELWHFSPETIRHALSLILKPLSIKATTPIENQLLLFLSQTKHLSWIIILSLLFSTFLLVNNLHATFDAIWEIEPLHRNLYLTLIHTFAIIWLPLFMTLLMSTESIMVAYSKSLSFLFPLSQIFEFFNLVICVIILSCYYWLLPSRKISYSHALLSSIITSLMIGVAKKGLTWYFLFAKQYSVLYGSLQAIPIFLFWVYVVWVLVLAGCALCRSLCEIN